MWSAEVKETFQTYIFFCCKISIWRFQIIYLSYKERKIWENQALLGASVDAVVVTGGRGRRGHVNQTALQWARRTHDGDRDFLLEVLRKRGDVTWRISANYWRCCCCCYCCDSGSLLKVLWQGIHIRGGSGGWSGWGAGWFTGWSGWCGGWKLLQLSCGFH